MTDPHDITCELVVIGAGMAGMAAALFAANRGIDTVQVGVASQLIFASGLLDLLAVHPVEKGKTWEDPWQAMDALTRDLPDHPYAKIPRQDIQLAFREIMDFLRQAGLVYHCAQDRNLPVITPLGTVKKTFCVPHTMKHQARAYEHKTPCLLVDIRGLRGFSARQIAETLKPAWPRLRHVSISFPDTEHLTEVYAEPLARSLALPGTRSALADILKPLLRDETVVGLPAMLGMYQPQEIMADLEERMGVSLFEIPTMPPSIPGLRIKEAFEARLPEKGLRPVVHKRVLSARREKRSFVLDMEDDFEGFRLRSDAVILASGRFIGRGLRADRSKISESIFGLPVFQPHERSKWHRYHFLDPAGHAINRAGIEIDRHFRPLDAAGKPAFENLFAAGSILAHQDWMRMKCGSGLAIASAYAAVQSFLRQRQHPLKRH